jgi:carboxylesterase type B
MPCPDAAGFHVFRLLAVVVLVEVDTAAPAAAAFQQQQQPSVSTQCGKIFGLWETPLSAPGAAAVNGGDEMQLTLRPTLAAFRGIKYGAPPLGPARWKPATPAACWPGSPALELNATTDGPMCMQGNSLGCSEDCLSLNVHIPATHYQHMVSHSQQTAGAGPAPSLLPVLLWIHGGANVGGSKSSYGPVQNMAASTQNHLLVSVNYRLGIFGWFALPELTSADPRNTSGNYGITDQQVALRWVREHIMHFGGDPQKVTILGQSSGGTSVYAHLASKGSKGLFHAAIGLSGSPNISMDQARKEQQDRALWLPRTPCQGLVGVAVLECLYTADASALLNSIPPSYELFTSADDYDYPTNKLGLQTRVATLVHVDGHTITDSLLDSLEGGLHSDVPVIFESAQAEMDCYPMAQTLYLNDSALQTFWQREFAPAFGAAMPAALGRLYQNFTAIDPEYSVYAIDSDTGSGCGLKAIAQAASRGLSSPVYLVTVSGPPSNLFSATSNQCGAGVGASVGTRFAFHNWDLSAAASLWGGQTGCLVTSEDYAFGELIKKTWLQLVTTLTLDPAKHCAVVDSGSNRDDNYCSMVFDKVMLRRVTGLKSEICNWWEGQGVSQNWWWIN